MKKVILKCLKPLSFLPAILMLYAIFFFSSQTGSESGELSYHVTYKVVEKGSSAIHKELSEEEKRNYTDRLHHPIRKLAHMGEYAFLAMTVCLPLYVYGMRGISLVLFSFLLSVAFAAGDEFHQSMVAGRGPAIKDVGFDSIGITVGLIISTVLHRILRAIHKRVATKNITESEL